MSVGMLHAAVLAHRQTFAGRLQFFVAHIGFFARPQALGRAFMGGCHGAVAGNVLPGFLVGMLSLRG